MIDNNFAEAVSPPVKIYVDAEVGDPVAAFKTEVAGHNTVKFINNSTADQAGGTELVKYIWDFDVSEDSTGDGIPDNDVDSEEREPEYTYEESGIYRAKLTVEDSFGNRDEVINFVNVKQSPEKAPVQKAEDELKADFTTNPPISSEDGAVHLEGDFGIVSFDFTKSKGNITKYVFDNNIYVDSSGSGRKADDVDYMTTRPGVYTTTFNPEEGRTRVRLTVYDAEGNLSIKEVNIVFDDEVNALGANLLFMVDNNQISAIVVSLLLFAIVSISLYLHSVQFERFQTIKILNKYISKIKRKSK